MNVAGTAAVGETQSAGGSDAVINLGATSIENKNFGRAENAQEGIVTAEDEEKLIVPAATMKLFGVLVTVALMMFMAMIDFGANINLAHVCLAEALGLHIFSHTDGRSVGTAKLAGIMHIVRWTFSLASTGPIALVVHALFMLL